MSIAKITKWTAADSSKSWLTIEEMLNDNALTSNEDVINYVNAAAQLQTLYLASPGFQQYFVSPTESGVRYSAVVFDTEENLSSAVSNISNTSEFLAYVSARNIVMSSLGVTLQDLGFIPLGEVTIAELVDQLKR